MKLETSLESFISAATMKNWRKLGIAYLPQNLEKNTQIKLTKRANKTLSMKYIFPIEYVYNKYNIERIKSLAGYIISSNYSIANSIYSLALNMLQISKILHKTHVQKVLKEYHFTCHTDLLNYDLPNDEKDLLGLIYQCLLLEGEKNIMGSYYTPHSIAEKMTKALDFSKNQRFLDPSCGSGAFLLAAKAISPNQICGIDNDPIAVFIAKINMLLQFIHFEFMPQVYCLDYLSLLKNNLLQTELVPQVLTQSFDYIITNPPWGSYKQNITWLNTSLNIASKERSSLFFANAYHQLSENGIIKFLLPYAILNVKSHRDLRAFILENGALQSISYYDNIFSGVSTNFVGIEHKKGISNEECKIIKKEQISFTPIRAFKQTKNLAFNPCTKQDINILRKIKNLSKYSLKNSIWALGIVTGDNGNTLYKEPITGGECIYTGKDILPYRLKKAQHFIIYNRDSLQQVAKDKYYRAKEKLIYKFISNKLLFAYDNSGALCLNSANILIPNVPNMSIKSVLGFLNSFTFQYLYRIMFGDIKILKGNLLELPFPHITRELDEKLSMLVAQAIAGDDEAHLSLQTIIYEIFHLTSSEQTYLEEVLHGNTSK